MYISMSKEKDIIKGTIKGHQIEFKKKEKKAILTATVSKKMLSELKMLIPEGEVSKFVNQIIIEGILKIEETISSEYKEFNKDQELSRQLEKLNICPNHASKKNEEAFKIERGDIFQLKKPAALVLIMNNKLHVLFSNYLTVILASDKNTEQVRETLEVPFELKNGKKIKLLLSCFYTISKQQLYNQGKFLGKIDEKTIEKLNNKVRSILDLNE